MNSQVQEEAFMLINSMAIKLDERFDVYTPRLVQKMTQFLEKSEDNQVISALCGTITDLCGIIQGKMGDHASPILSSIVGRLQQKMDAQNNKDEWDQNAFRYHNIRHMISCIGDIALAIGPNFLFYFPDIIPLINAMTTEVISTSPHIEDDYNMLEYINLLREALCECYQGIVQSLTEDPQGIITLYEHIPIIMRLVAHIASDSHRTEHVSRSAVGLVLDIASSYEGKVKKLVKQPFIVHLINETKQMATSEETEKTCRWAYDIINAL
jgi:importin subunit beta-1